ncbi:MAG TPA: DUF6036 family nucleotidyltransferase [Kofleriaceae bacterium]|nr:DUF6036 family nucleotidyltransferase [Kofleriaceae bacterium]
MKRTLLDELLCDVERITGERDLVMIGSQAIHAVAVDVPAEVVISRECDLLFDESDPVVVAIDSSLGPGSERAAELLVHVDTVNSSFPFLAPGWEQRLIPFGSAAPHVRCLEIHDLVLSKLAAGRLKDYELIAVLLDRGLADLRVVCERIAGVPDLHMRAILMARLQIVVESTGR